MDHTFKHRIAPLIVFGLILPSGCVQQVSAPSPPPAATPLDVTDTSKPIPLVGADSSTCSAALGEALKTRYTGLKASTTVDAVMELACSAENQSLEARYGAYSLEAAQVKQACTKKYEAFFQRYKENIAFSFLPPEAFPFLSKMCSASGLGLTVEGSVGDQVTIRAIWIMPAGMTNVPTTMIVATPTVTGPAVCQFKSLTPATILGNAEKTDVCRRTRDGQVSVVLRTANGDAFGSATRNPPKATYVLNMIGADDAASCVLNGTHVASIGIGSSAMGITLNPHLKDGTNTLTCTVEDLKQCSNSHPCWSYSFELLQNGARIWSPSFACNDSSPRCEAKGETVSTTFTFR